MAFFPCTLASSYLRLSTAEVSSRNIAPCSPLPSGGITRFHRYYGTVRMPVTLLPSSVSCPAYHSPHLLLSSMCRESGSSLCVVYGDYRLSPVDTTPLCDMTDLRPRSAAVESHQSDYPACCLPPSRKCRHASCIISGLKCLMTLSPNFPCFTQHVAMPC